MISDLKKGMQVYFEGPEGRIFGTVSRVNKKTVSVDPGDGSGNYYRVSPEMLSPAIDRMAAVGASMQRFIMRVSQDQIYDCLMPDGDAETQGRTQRLISAFNNPEGHIHIVADALDVHRKHIHGWEALAILMRSKGATLSMAGRLSIEVNGFDDDPRELFQIPETRAWFLTLQDLYPWMGAWLSPERKLGSLFVGALAPFEIENGQTIVKKPQLEAAVHIANFAAGFSLRLGAKDISHVYAFLKSMSFADVPDGFFDGAGEFADKLDDYGRLLYP